MGHVDSITRDVKMNKIQKISSYIVLILKILMIFFPCFIILTWFFISNKPTQGSLITGFFATLENTIHTPHGAIDLHTVAWTPMLKLLGCCADVIGNLPFLVSLFFLKALFSHYQKGDIFSQRNPILYRYLGALYVADALFIKSLSQTLMGLAVTLTYPPGHRYLTISLGTPNLSSLFYGMLVIIVSWVMLEASKLHDEHKFTI
jgi:hypothetical protein